MGKIKVTVLGAGKIGEAICGLLSFSGRYTAHVVDIDEARASAIAALFKDVTSDKIDLKSEESLKQSLEGSAAVISALPFHCNVAVAKVVATLPVHYFDLTEDVETTKKIFRIADKALGVMMPQCGIAPGFVSIAAAHLSKSFDRVDSLKLRVGALPMYPTNKLKYNLTWSTEGLINQYGNSCELISGGEKTTAPALLGYETFSLDGVEYEAFNTSGGLGTLCDSLLGKVRELNYKSVRYPGHRDYIALLMNDLQFNEDRATLKKVFDRSLSFTKQDKCLVLVEAQGTLRGKFIQKTYASTVYNEFIEKQHFGAIQITTAAGVLAPMDLVLTGKVAVTRGVLKAEDISLIDFLQNHFGAYYADELAMKGIME